MTDNNVILEGDFLFFDVGVRNSQEKGSKYWCEKLPRKVKVTFEKNLADDSFCLRLMDPGRKHRAVYYHLDKAKFCGTDVGTLVLAKASIFCWKRQTRYSYLSVFLTADVNQDWSSCVLLRTHWPEDDQNQWMKVIDQHMGFRNKWSVTIIPSKPERVTLCLTEKGLALNNTTITDTSYPKCVWHHTFREFQIMSTYQNGSNQLDIIAKERREEQTEGELYKYEVLTSHGEEIETSIHRAGLILMVPSGIQRDPASFHKAPDHDAPTPCSNTPIFVSNASPILESPIEPAVVLRTLPPSPAPPSPSPAPPSPPPPAPPTPTYGKPEDLPKPPPRCPSGNTKSGRISQHPMMSLYKLKTFRRSYSMGEKELLSRKKSRKALLREKVSVSGGYESDSDEIYEFPVTESETIRTADRSTLYVHKKWYKSFKTQIKDSVLNDSEADSKTEPHSSKRFTHEEDYYWIGEVSFTLQNRLEGKLPDPDTMQLGWRQKVRLTFNLYPSGPGVVGGWQDLAEYIGLSAHEITMVEHFCLAHNGQTPVSVLLDHWQFVYNKQLKQQEKEPTYVPVCPPCDQQHLAKFLQEVERFDILEICNLAKPKT